MTPTHFAYKISVEHGTETREYIGTGTDLYDATGKAAARLEAMGAQEASLIAISRIGPALVREGWTQSPACPTSRVRPTASVQLQTEAPPPPTRSARGAKPTLEAPKGAGGTRAEQLVRFLEEAGGQANLDQIAEALGTSKPNAQNAIAPAVKQRVARRVGRRTGEVALVQPELPSPQPDEPSSTRGARSGPTRGEQVVGFLRDHGGEAHISEIAEALATNVPNAQNAIAGAVKLGLVRRVGTRTGRVALVPAPAADGAQRSVRAEELEGLQKRVYEALRERGQAVTAKELAGLLGGRPREAGNAASLLVGAGLVRRSGDARPVKYECV